MIRFSDEYLVADVLASHQRCDGTIERYAINRAAWDYLKALGMKHQFRFPKTPSGQKRCTSKVRALKKALADFPDFAKIDIEEHVGFDMLF